MLRGERRQRIDQRSGVIHAGDAVVCAATGAQENGARADIEFFQRFQTVGGKAGTEHIDAPRFCRAKPLKQRGGCRLQPGCQSKARRKADLPMLFGEIQRLRKQCRGAPAVRFIRVAAFDHCLRQAVKTEQQLSPAAKSGRLCIDQSPRILCAHAAIYGGKSAKCRIVRISGKSRMYLHASNVASNAEAVAAAEYCGYIGSNNTRSMPSRCNCWSLARILGAP